MFPPSLSSSPFHRDASRRAHPGWRRDASGSAPDRLVKLVCEGPAAAAAGGMRAARATPRHHRGAPAESPLCRSFVMLGPCPLVPPVTTRTPELAARSPRPARSRSPVPLCGGGGGDGDWPRLPSAASSRSSARLSRAMAPTRAAHPSRRGTASRVSRSRRQRRAAPGAPGREQESRTHPCPPAHTPRPAAAPRAAGQRAGLGTEGTAGDSERGRGNSAARASQV